MSGKQSGDLRGDRDRRQDDVGPPPGVAERRINPERRHPEVEDLGIVEHIDIEAPAGFLFEGMPQPES